MNKLNSNLVVGGILILVGAGLMFDRLNLFSFGWQQTYPIIFLLIAAVALFNAANGQKNSAFWGGIFLVLGIFYFVRNFALLHVFWFADFWPVFLIALGVGFIFLYIFHPQDWGVLIPAVVLLFIGGSFMLESLEIIDDAFEIVFDFISVYWPLIFVAIGIVLILNSLKTTRNSNDKIVVDEKED